MAVRFDKAVLLLLAVLALAGCGRQLTGLTVLQSGLVPSGQTLIRFETAGALDFRNVSYLIVLNTSGNGHQPFALGYSTFADWSYFFIVGGGRGYAQAPLLEQVYQDPASGGSLPRAVPYAAQAVTFRPSTGNADSQFGFEIRFDRCIVDEPAPSASPPPFVTTNRICPPFLYGKPAWNVSLFTVDRTSSVIDSLSPSGATGTDYDFGFDTSQSVQTNHFKPRTNTSVQNPGAQIVGVEVFSTP